jgi:integral membrane protein (TIGR00529 family)
MRYSSQEVKRTYVVSFLRVVFSIVLSHSRHTRKIIVEWFRGIIYQRDHTQCPKGQCAGIRRTCFIYGVFLEFLISLPAFVKVGGAFTGILVLSRLRLSLGLSMIIAALLLALWNGSGMAGSGRVFYALGEPTNVLLLCVILLLLIFSDALSSSGRMEKTVGALRTLFKSDRLLVAGLPALIGLLPMPGGALFSAPFVASADSGNHLKPHLKTAINYWFRHIWEFWWPLYPGVILAMQYAKLPVWLFFLIQAPFSLFAIFGGWLFMLRTVSHRSGPAYPEAHAKQAFSTLAPVGVLVAISIAGSSVLPMAGVRPSIANLCSMLLGLVVVISWIGAADRAAFRKTLGILKKQSTWSLMLVVAGALLFSATLSIPVPGTGATLVSQMRDEFMRLGVPFFLLAFIIPFISGMVTGIAVAFVGASFPIIFALLGDHPPLHSLIATTSLAFVSGHMGEMLSPVHICFLVSKEYFKTSLRLSYRYLLGPAFIMALAVALVCCGYYFFIR